MEENKQIVAAIDVGTTKVVAVIGRKNDEGKIEVIGFASVPSDGMIRGTVSNVIGVTKSIGEAVDAVQKQSGLRITEAHVGIAGQHINCIQQMGYHIREGKDFSTPFTADDVYKITRSMLNMSLNPGEQIIQIIPQSYSVDNEITENPIGMQGSRLEVNYHIVTGRQNFINMLKQCVEENGIKVLSITLEPIVSACSVLSADEMELGVALVDIGGGTTDLAIFHGSKICYTSSIPFAGNAVTTDIQNGCGVLQRVAEHIKTLYGAAVLTDPKDKQTCINIPGLPGRRASEISLDTLSQIIGSRVGEIFDEVKRQIINSGYANKLPAGIVLTGGGSLLKNLKTFVSFKFGFDVVLGVPKILVTSAMGDEYVDIIQSPANATAIGLLLRGFNAFDELSKLEYNIGESLVYNESTKEQVEDQTKVQNEVVSEPTVNAEKKDKKERLSFKNFGSKCKKFAESVVSAALYESDETPSQTPTDTKTND